MNTYNFHQFNPNCYKNHLSPFGRNVLDNLIKHWRKGFDSNENRRRNQLLKEQNRRNTRLRLLTYLNENEKWKNFRSEWDLNPRPSSFYAASALPTEPSGTPPESSNLSTCSNSPYSAPSGGAQRHLSDFYGYPQYPRSNPYTPSVPPSPAGPINDGRALETNHFDDDDYLLPEAPIGEDSRSAGEVDYEADNIYQAPPQFNDDYFAVPRLPVVSTGVSVNTGKKALGEASQVECSNFLIQHRGVQNGHIQLNGVEPEVPMPQKRTDCENISVLTTDDLARTFDIANTNEEEILTANDMITPVIHFENINEKLLLSKKYINPHTPAKMVGELLKKTDDINYKTNEETKKSTSGSNEESVIKNVDWDDMFDSELLLDVKNQMMHLDYKRDNLKIEFPKDKNKKPKQTVNKVTKRKTQTNMNGKLPIKVVKVIQKELDYAPSNTNLRKLNCKTAVKNWLDDVNSDNVFDDEMNQYGLNSYELQPKTVHDDIYIEKCKSGIINKLVMKEKAIDDCAILKDKTYRAPESEERVGIVNKLINNAAKEMKLSRSSVADKAAPVKGFSARVGEHTPNKKNKKVIQTTLAQKDGKMKFGPPVKGPNENKTELSVNNETESEEGNKDKKAKSKFVPPIKSQIPVKNIIFDVNTINESNSRLLYDLVKLEDNEVTVILIYKNGFCQLNNHHTEETCVPEGILIKLSNEFFYFKNEESNSDLLKQILNKSKVICYNGKNLLTYLISKYDVELKQDAFHFYDAKIGASLIDPDNTPENFAEVQKLVGFTPEFTIATECVLQKAAWYITLLRECFDKLKALLEENSVWNVFTEIEMPLLPVIAGMEFRGVSVDLEKIKAMENILLRKMKSVEQECYKAAGKTFQINSTLQVRTILYDELQLDTKSNLKIKETIGKGAKSTSETMLRGLVSLHPLPRLILEYRHLHKAHATFLTGIAQHVKDGTVKPTWVQMAAATGRIASNNPNLQAIPKAPFNLVVFPEHSDDQEPQLNFRSVYTARPQHSLVAADFKHIECRVFAYAADDAILLDALKSGQDLFRVLAAKWLNKAVEEVSTEDRERTKRIVYASLYGAGARKLMDILHVSYEQALSVLTSFNRTFPALKSFGRAVVLQATNGALRSLCGRSRRFPHITSADQGLKAQAERQAVNFVVQGSAADLCKKAMVAVQRRLDSSIVNCSLVLQIHDELVWEVEDADLTRAATIIKDAMENIGRDCGMGMTLPVELMHGRNWGEMKPFEP